MKLHWIHMIVILSTGMSAQGATIFVWPFSQEVLAGSQLSVELYINNTGDQAKPVGAFDLDFTFDPNVLSFVTVVYGTNLDVLGQGSIRVTTANPGTVNLFELSFDTTEDLGSLQPETFVLATLTFDAVTAGNSSLELSLNAISDSFGESIPSTSIGGIVGIVPNSPILGTPEPSTVRLMTGSLTLLLLFLKRRESRFKAVRKPSPIPYLRDPR